MDNEDKKVRKQDERAEETKRSIAESAGRLFTARGYDAVTIREIAKEAGCSHTTIYLYFKDKEALLEQLAIPPLTQLEQSILSIKNQQEWSAAQKLKEKSRAFVRFCLSHKSMVSIILEVKSVRVDIQDPEGSVNKLRTRIFAHLTDGIEQMVPGSSKQEGINHTRIYFFMLYGLVHTYMNNEEPLESLLERILPVLDEGVDVLITGMQQKRQSVQREVQPEIQPEIQPEVQTEVQLEVQSEIQPVAKSEAKSEAQPEIQPKVKTKEKSKEKSKEKTKGKTKEKTKERPEAEQETQKGGDSDKEARKEKKQNKKNKDKKLKKQEGK